MCLHPVVSKVVVSRMCHLDSTSCVNLAHPGSCVSSGDIRCVTLAGSPRSCVFFRGNVLSCVAKALSCVAKALSCVTTHEVVSKRNFYTLYRPYRIYV
jgi:hypothetical protein